MILLYLWYKVALYTCLKGKIMVSYYLRLYKFDIFLRIKEMNILKKIGTPFIAVWRWIKETAWVQPLLIVGIIFAIIFSIPSITRGIQGLVNQTESDLVYFSERQLSLEGSKVTEDHAPDSAANIFFDDFLHFVKITLLKLMEILDVQVSERTIFQCKFIDQFCL